MTTKEMLVELEYALLCNDKRNQEELYKLLEAKGINSDEANNQCFKIYVKGDWYERVY